jgi:hypothetical protein
LASPPEWKPVNGPGQKIPFRFLWVGLAIPGASYRASFILQHFAALVNKMFRGATNY